MDNIQDILDKLNGDTVSSNDVKRSLKSKNILVKCNAIFAVVRLGIFDEEIIRQLEEIAKNINTESRVLGSWNNGHFALAALKLLNTEASLVKYKKLSYSLNTYQKEDINRLINQWPI